MSHPISITKSSVWISTNYLIDKVIDFADQLPEDGCYNLKSKLIYTSAQLKPQLEETLKKNRKIDKIRNYLKLSSLIGEIRDYLILAGQMRYSDVNEILNVVNDIKKNLYVEFPNMTVN